MKRKVLVPIVIVVLTSLLVLGGVIGIRIYAGQKNFKIVDQAISSIVDLQATAIYEGYFAWTRMYDLMLEGKIAESNALLMQAASSYALVATIEIAPGEPPPANYLVKSDGELIRIIFPIRNDTEELTIPNWVGIATISSENLIRFMNIENFKLDPVRGEKTALGIPLSYKLFSFMPWDIVTMVALVILLSALFIQAYFNVSSYFVQTRGLESIIYLFEQTERASASHSRNVAMLALYVGKLLGLRGKRLKNLYVAALLHDIGKIGIPTQILAKTGKLDSMEFAQMKQHPVISARILRSFKEFEHLSRIVLYHHERMDGSGYPEGLKGNEIPLESRIIAVVDVFEALIGERPYRSPIHPSSAFEKMKNMKLDQQIVETLAKNHAQLASFKPPRWVLSYSPWIISA